MLGFVGVCAVIVKLKVVFGGVNVKLKVVFCATRVLTMLNLRDRSLNDVEFEG